MDGKCVEIYLLMDLDRKNVLNVLQKILLKTMMKIIILDIYLKIALKYSEQLECVYNESTFNEVTCKN